MRIQLLLISVCIFASCKTDRQDVAEKHILDSLGFDDYREIVRHPISLSETMDSSEWSQISFETNTFDFDTVTSGEVLKSSFRFTNSGNKPLYILDTKVSCGCTIANYTEGPILPRESGLIEVIFNTKGKIGFQNKSILVLSNSYPNENRLFIQGYLKQ